MNKKLLGYFYIEVITNDDVPYVMQTATFDTPRKAFNAFKKMFDYINFDIVRVEMMAMEFNTAEDIESFNYDIVSVGFVNYDGYHEYKKILDEYEIIENC